MLLSDSSTGLMVGLHALQMLLFVDIILTKDLEFLEEQNIAPYHTKQSRSSSASSSNNWSYHSVSPRCKRSTSVSDLIRSPATSSSFYGSTEQQGTRQSRAPTVSSAPPTSENSDPTNTSKKAAALKQGQKPTAETCSPQRTSSTPPRDADENLQIIAKDSMENLQVSPPRTQAMSPPPIMPNSVIAALLSPRKVKKKNLTLDIDGSEVEFGKNKRRPLSPFTSGGMLRSGHGLVPPSAPAAVTEFGLTVAEEVEAQIAKEKAERRLQKPPVSKVSTTRAERGGQILLGFLGRRLGRAERITNA